MGTAAAEAAVVAAAAGETVADAPQSPRVALADLDSGEDDAVREAESEPGPGTSRRRPPAKRPRITLSDEELYGAHVKPVPVDVDEVDKYISMEDYGDDKNLLLWWKTQVCITFSRSYFYFNRFKSMMCVIIASSLDISSCRVK